MTNLLSVLERSPWLRLVRALLAGAALWLASEDSAAEAAKASGAPVTSLDVPAGLAPLLLTLAAALRGGEPNAR